MPLSSPSQELSLLDYDMMRYDYPTIAAAALVAAHRMAGGGSRSSSIGNASMGGCGGGGGRKSALMGGGGCRQNALMGSGNSGEGCELEAGRLHALAPFLSRRDVGECVDALAELHAACLRSDCMGMPGSFLPARQKYDHLLGNFQSAAARPR